MAFTLDGDPISRVKCTYPDCIKTFASRREMIYHKLDEPEHNYCKKCDVDCGDWEDFTQHKVEAMAPFLEGAMNGAGISPKHIVCEFCGEDFKSFGGRKIHRRQIHPADQSISCPGCSQIFVRAAMMVGHIERGWCSVIKAREFRAHIQHKFILKEIMSAPDVFAQNLQINKAFAPGPANPGLVTEGSVTDATETDTQADTDGGVTLLDQDIDTQRISLKPLQAQINLIELEEARKAPLTRNNLENWPRLPLKTVDKRGDVNEYLRNVSVGSPPPSSVAGSEMSASQYASEITSRRGGHKVHTASVSGIQSPEITASATSSCSSSYDAGDDDDNASVTTARPEAVLARPPAWTTKNTSRALFAKAEPTPPSAAELLRREEEEAANTPNLFTARFWDPFSKDYNSDRFFHTVLQKYCCPFPDCIVDPSDDLFTLECHLLESHARVKFRCTACLKVFRTAEGLMAHCESNGNCPIQKHDNFFKMLDEMTGGFVKAKSLAQPLIYRPNQAMVKAGKPAMDGVMSTLYKGKMPHER